MVNGRRMEMPPGDTLPPAVTGASTVGQNLLTLANPSALVWLRVNADNTVTARSASETRGDLGLAIGSDVQAYSANLASWAGVTRASGFDSFAATPNSANLRALLTDETGTGAAVFAGSPTFTGTANFAALSASGAVDANSTTDSVSVGTGSLRTAGGLSVQKQIFTGGNQFNVTPAVDYEMVHRSTGGWDFYTDSATKLPFRIARLAPTNALQVQQTQILAGLPVVVTGALSTTTTIKPGSYTVATLPSAASAGRGAQTYCTDETGGEIPVFSDATNWRRVSDRTIAA